MTLPSGARFGRYVIDRLLGEGGMGIVYAAHDPTLGRRVALKMLRHEVIVDPRLRERLLREARAGAGLSHPNATTVYEVGEHDDQPYIAMEFLDGQPLRARIGDSQIDIATRLRWLTDIARVLAAAHASGLVHRDIKPENVMLTRDGIVKVLDFGITRALAGFVDPNAGTLQAEAPQPKETITTDGVMIGTPLYMAPEQMLGNAIDGRTDQFAWGVTAYELLSGHVPWRVDRHPSGAARVIALVVSDRPAPVLGGAGISKDVRAVVAKALEKEPERRFASMTQIVDALEAALTGKAKAIPVAAQTDVAIATPRAPAEVRGAHASKSRKGRAIGLVLLVVTVIAATAIALRSRPTVAFGVASSLPPSASGSAAAPPVVALVERRLTAFTPENRVRALGVSADGRSYAYADEEGVWLASVADPTRRRIPMPAELDPNARPNEIEFFPDGARVLVGGWKKDDAPTWIVPLDGSVPTRARVARRFALSPDGARLAFVRDEAIVIGPVEGGPPTRVASIAHDEEVRLAWSPDGSALALARNLGAQVGKWSWIEVVASDGSWSRTLVTFEGLVFVGESHLTWTTNDRVAYTQEFGEGEDTTAIMEVRLDASHGVAEGPRRVWSESLTGLSDLKYRAGRFFFVRIDSQRDVYVGRVAVGATRFETPLTRFTTSETNDSLAGWLPDGRVLFTSMRDGKARVYAQGIDKRVPEPIVAGDTEMVAVAALADGDVIAIRHAGAESFIVRVHPGGATRDLFSLGTIPFRRGRAELCARCSTNASPRCVISETSGDESAFSLFDPATGMKSPPFVRVEKIAFLPYCTLAGDGSTLYLPGGDKIRAVNVATGATRELKGPAASRIQYVSPIADGRTILFSGMSLFDHECAIGRMGVDGRADSLWTSDVLWVWSPMLAPNGRDIAAVVRINDTDVWMVAPRDAQ